MIQRRHFLVGGLGLASVGLGSWVLRQTLFSQRDLTQARPLPLRPFSAPELVQERAKRALELAIPCHRLNYSEVVHALRFLGPSGSAKAPGCYGGPTMLAMLLDDQAQARFFPESRLLTWTEMGPCHSLATPGHEGDSHAGYSLSVLAELEIPLSMPIRAQGRFGTVHDLLTAALAHFSWNGEWEWWISAFARYLPPQYTWQNQHGDTFHLDQVVTHVLAQPYEVRECFGSHALLSLVTILRADTLAPSLRPTTREALKCCLEDANRRLAAHQLPSGLWGKAWHGPQPGSTPDSPDDFLVGTGHALEWLAWCSPELRLPRARIEGALEALVLLMLQHGTGRQGHLPYAAFTHAARALNLWLGHVPTWETRTGPDSTLR